MCPIKFNLKLFKFKLFIMYNHIKLLIIWILLLFKLLKLLIKLNYLILLKLLNMN